ncbi:hemolysin III family protein [Curvibacter sp. APW13]|uniref:PAQR family membrane homeostasis protein TrhA n=1 Tax=Curvibacter sp. APW13 TaxID=3077236 RepID=UPI0028DF717E|nr:hemolysin III family protein [Curvibacter sp. APW13]MDT8992020.1 hemolysin III family protein [Curvibacter sp. APW13]
MYPGERFNAISHLVGAALAVSGLSILMTLAVQQGNVLKGISFAVYGGTLVLLYGFSTLYHAVRTPHIKAVLQKLDHHAIYLLIAGTYTPIALITLQGAWGWTLFGLVWALAITGMLQEHFLGRRTRKLSLVLYALMGWLVVIAWKPLALALPTAGLAWLLAGGLAYSGGIWFYVQSHRVRHGHGIWHLFVLAGSLCHFLCMLLYVA